MQTLMWVAGGMTTGLLVGLGYYLVLDWEWWRSPR